MRCIARCKRNLDKSSATKKTAVNTAAIRSHGSWIRFTEPKFCCKVNATDIVTTSCALTNSIASNDLTPQLRIRYFASVRVDSLIQYFLDKNTRRKNFRLRGRPWSFIVRMAISPLENKLAQKSLRLGSPKNDAVVRKLLANALRWSGSDSKLILKPYAEQWWCSGSSADRPPWDYRTLIRYVFRYH